MKVFVAVVVIAAFCTVLITAVSDEQNKAWTEELENEIDKINTAVAYLTERKDTWFAQVTEDLSFILSNSLPEIQDLFAETLENVKVMVNDADKDASSCLKSASSDITQNINDVDAALNEIRETALDFTYTEQTIESNIRYANIVLHQLNGTLEHLDCLGPQPANPEFCVILNKPQLDDNIRYFYDEVSRIFILIGDYSMGAYSIVTEARIQTYKTASENARILEENVMECIDSL